MDNLGYAMASPDDLPDVTALLDQCGLPAEDLRPAHLAHFVVYRLGERIVGTVGLEPLGQVGLVRSLAVATQLRGRRLGHGLWARIRDHALACKIQRLYLLTTTAADLFTGWGFRAVSRDQVEEVVRTTTEWNGLCPSTAVVMSMDLGVERARGAESSPPRAPQGS